MVSALRILCWNINEGKGDSRDGKIDAELDRIAKNICLKSPDIVLLNEVRDPSWSAGGFLQGRKPQAHYLAEKTGLPYSKFGQTNRTGPWLFGTGWKGVAVLSRYPLESERLVPVMRGAKEESAFKTLVTSITIGGKRHHILSTRLAPHNDAGNRKENPMGVLQAIQLAKSFDRDSPIFFGGDFNASTERGTNEYEDAMGEFFDKSELTEVVKEGQLPIDNHRVDYLFYRGNYKVTKVEFGHPDPKASDHPWIFAVLESM